MVSIELKANGFVVGGEIAGTNKAQGTIPGVKQATKPAWVK